VVTDRHPTPVLASLSDVVLARRGDGETPAARRQIAGICACGPRPARAATRSAGANWALTLRQAQIGTDVRDDLELAVEGSGKTTARVGGPRRRALLACRRGLGPGSRKVRARNLRCLARPLTRTLKAPSATTAGTTSENCDCKRA